MDNASEFLVEAVTNCSRKTYLAIQYRHSGKPNQNAYVEHLKRTYREDLLDQHLFLSFADVRQARYWWMIGYNEEHPQNALYDLAPIEARQEAASSASLEVSPLTGKLTRPRALPTLKHTDLNWLSTRHGGLD